MQNNKEFCAISLVKAIRNSLIDTNYLVYKNKTEFIAVKANSAFEAITLSKVEKPHKVIHLTPNIDSFLEEEDLKFIDESKIINNFSAENELNQNLNLDNTPNK